MSSTEQSVTRVVHVGPDRLFAVLIDPAQHAAIDGSGTVRGAATTERLTKVGDVFRIDMNQPAMGDYQMDNHVVEFEDGKKIAWAPGQAGGDPLGHRWVWELSGDGDSTTVTHTYQWSGVNEQMLARIPFPLVTEDQMAASIDRLAAAAS